MIQQTGVPWVDMDMVCLNHSEILKQDYVFIKEKQMSGGQYLTTSLMKFPPGSAFGEKLVRESQEIIAGRKMVEWGIIGPDFLARCVQEANLEHHALDAQVACQIPWFQVEQLVSPNVAIDETQPCLHFYTEAWRRKGLRKDTVYAPKSFYSRLLARHDIASLLAKCDYRIGFLDKYANGKISLMRLRLRKMKMYFLKGCKNCFRSFGRLFKKEMSR